MYVRAYGHQVSMVDVRVLRACARGKRLLGVININDVSICRVRRRGIGILLLTNHTRLRSRDAVLSKTAVSTEIDEKMVIA